MQKEQWMTGPSAVGDDVDDVIWEVAMKHLATEHRQVGCHRRHPVKCCLARSHKQEGGQVFLRWEPDPTS